MHFVRYFSGIINTALIAGSALFVVGCSKDKTPDPNPAPHPTVIDSATIAGLTCRVKEIITPRYTETAGYNSDGIVISIGYTLPGQVTPFSISTIGYNSLGKITKITSGELDYYLYEYDPDGKLLTETLYTKKTAVDAFTLSFTYTYAYNDEGLVETITNNNDFYIRIGYDDNGNWVKKFQGTGTVDKLSAEVIALDDKKNPMYDFPFLTAFYTDMYGVVRAVTQHNSIVNRNNILDARAYNDDPAVQPIEIIGVYQYNASGYVTQQVQKQQNLPDLTNTYTYYYK
jgi:hypothetical protein